MKCHIIIVNLMTNVFEFFEINLFGSSLILKNDMLVKKKRTVVAMIVAIAVLLDFISLKIRLLCKSAECLST